MATKYTVSPEERQFYEDNGYLIIQRLIDPATMDLCRQRFTRVCTGELKLHDMSAIVKERSLEAKGAKGEELINKVSEVHHDEGFMTYSEHPRLLHVVSQFIGDEIIVINGMLINKPPGSKQHPPHQDLFYFPYRPPEKLIGTWTAMDDSTVDNGCLFVVPNTHRNVLYPHERLTGFYRLYHTIMDPVILERPRVYLEMSPGDTLFIHPLLVHGSGPNNTKSYRKCLSGHYMSKHCRYIDVSNTLQSGLAKEFEAEAIRRGYPMGYEDIWRLKNKPAEWTSSQCKL